MGRHSLLQLQDSALCRSESLDLAGRPEVRLRRGAVSQGLFSQATIEVDPSLHPGGRILGSLPRRLELALGLPVATSVEVDLPHEKTGERVVRMGRRSGAQKSERLRITAALEGGEGRAHLGRQA